MSLIHFSSQTAYPISEWLGVYPCMRWDLFVCVCSALGKQTRVEKLHEHRENKDQKRWGLGIELCTNYRKHHSSGTFRRSVFWVSTASVTSTARLSNNVPNFFAEHLGKVFLFLLTDVSLSLTLSETQWKVAAVSEVPPRSVLINHPQSLYSPLSPSLSPASLASSLSLLI